MGPRRKTHQIDLAAARAKWIGQATRRAETRQRDRSDFLAYRNHAGRYADFHSRRHLFMTRLEQAGISPKVAQTLARHSGIRLLTNVDTHEDLVDYVAPIGALPGPPGPGTV